MYFDRYVNDMINDLTSWLGSSITVRNRIDGAARPGAEAGHEHFGFLDGISQVCLASLNSDPILILSRPSPE
jgi:hypothetical protein